MAYTKDHDDPSAVDTTGDLQSSVVSSRDDALHFDAFLKMIPHAAIVVDSSRRVTKANAGFTSVFGYLPEELIGVTTETLYEDDDMFAELGRERFNLSARESAKPYEVTYRRKDGSTFLGETTTRSVTGDSGEIVGFVGVVRDVTGTLQSRRLLDREKVNLERKVATRTRELAVANRALERSNYRLRQIFETNVAIKLLIDPSTGAIVDANSAACRFYGWSREELLSKAITDINTLSSEQVFAEMERSRSESRLFFKFRHRLASGDIRDVEVFSGPIQDEGRDLLYSIIFDVTERTCLEERLRESQKLKAVGTLAGGIAHDFNNILSVIVSCAELSFGLAPPGSELDDNLENILTVSMRGRDLVKQILMFSNRGSDQGTPIEPHQIVSEVVGLLRKTLPATVQLELHIDPECGTIQADPTQLHQVILNLCTNAQHATRNTDRGLIKVVLERLYVDADLRARIPALTEGQYIRLSVADNGCGIPPELRKHIFEPFFTTKAPGEGTGMGLAVVHGIVQRQSGVIHVESSVDCGTKFDVFWPATTRSAPERDGDDRERAVSGKEHILLVDDEELFLDATKRILERLGYRVTALSSSVDTLDLFSRTPDHFDLLVTDQAMPAMTGASLTMKVLAIRPDLPIIIVSGFSRELDLEGAVKLGAYTMFPKPFRASDLAAVVRQALE